MTIDHNEQVLWWLLVDPLAVRKNTGNTIARLARLAPLIRTRAAGFALILITVAAALLAVSLWTATPAEPIDTPVVVSVNVETVSSADETVSEPPAAVEPIGRSVHTTLGRGGTIAAALERLGLPTRALPEVAEALKGHLDLRRLPADTGLVLVHDEQDRPWRLGVRARPTQFVRITFAGDLARVPVDTETIELPTETRLETTSGVVDTSIVQALSDSPHGHELALAFADIFRWDVDLSHDPRRGDRVRVVYETTRLAEPPADLPEFGDAPTEAGRFLKIGRILAASYDGEQAASSGFWVDSRDGGGGFYDQAGNPLRKTFLRSPLSHYRITSGFSRARRHPVTRRVTAHTGVDFAASKGTPVLATADGRVVSVAWEGPLGRAIRIRHGGDYTSVYGHLSGYASQLSVGSVVKQSQVIGYVGSTGRATGPHVHYALLNGKQAIDPLRFDNPVAEPLPSHQLPHLDEAMRRWLPMLSADEREKPGRSHPEPTTQADSTVLVGA